MQIRWRNSQPGYHPRPGAAVWPHIRPAGSRAAAKARAGTEPRAGTSWGPGPSRGPDRGMHGFCQPPALPFLCTWKALNKNLLREQLNLIFTASKELEVAFFHFADGKSEIHRKKMPQVTQLGNRKFGNQIDVFSLLSSCLFLSLSKRDTVNGFSCIYSVSKDAMGSLLSCCHHC